MNRQKGKGNSPSVTGVPGLTGITVSGYKSICQEQSIEIRPLTLLAGINSSGKSSILQPLLLLKQTLEASYDPGALLINGPIVKFSSADQLLSRVGRDGSVNTFHVGISVKPHLTLTLSFIKEANKGFEIKQMKFERGDKTQILRPEMTHEELMRMIFSDVSEKDKDIYEVIKKARFELFVARNRCFLEVGMRLVDQLEAPLLDRVMPLLEFLVGYISPKPFIEPHIRDLIHLPGLRGNPERTYPVTAVGQRFPGTFENYVASVITHWQATGDNRLEKLSSDLERLGLTWKVTAKPINDVQVELMVGRLTHAARGGAHDLVSIADVGFGVSQTLPVLVALHVARPGQVLYLEQPEIHLHPRAQSAMAQVLADAANRGARVIIETHSNLLLLGIQTLVAEGRLSPEIVKLHWFRRNGNGTTEIVSAELNEAGAFGDWPGDFADVALTAESNYLDAIESRRGQK